MIDTTANNIMSGEHFKNYVLAGRAIFTITAANNTRYTYRVSQDKDNPRRFFVRVLFGPDNEQDYRYLGLFYDDSLKLRLTKASIVESKDNKALVFQALLDDIDRGYKVGEYSLYPSCKCARCGRRLTTPESIKLGLGPECVNYAR